MKAPAGVSPIVPTRIPWVDTAKGIGIALVVLAHADTAKTSLWRFIYIFHMPLFFFLSGYLYVARRGLGSFFTKKSIHLLLPYASFFVLFFPLILCSNLWHHVPAHEIRDLLFNLLWGGDRTVGYCGTFWFLTCLFLTQQAMNVLLVKCRSWIVAAIVTVALLLSYLNSVYFPRFELPLAANVVCAAMPFFFTGYMWRKYASSSRWIGIVSGVGVICAVWALRMHLAVNYDMSHTQNGVPLVSLILALCCIWWVLRVSRLMERVSPARKLFGRLGRASMGIMIIHRALQFLSGTRQLWAHLSVVSAFLLLLSVSYLLTMLLTRFSVTRALFLGSDRDLIAVMGRIPFLSNRLEEHSLSSV